MQNDRRQIQTASNRPPAFVGHRSPFIRRTVWATLITLGLVALNVAVYASPAWAGWYFVSGLWTLVFFALTPLILKEMLFDRRKGRALGLIAAKLAWMGAMVGLCLLGGGTPHFGSALVAGITTPLAVVTLRALGAMLTSDRGAGRLHTTTGAGS